MIFYPFEMLKAIAPFATALCMENFVHRQGEFCNIRDYQIPVVKYDKQDSKDACYKDGIFYPRCKDLENPEVLHYHNLLLGKK